MSSQAIRLFGLSPSVIQSLKAIFGKNARVERAVVYGSRAKGTFRDGSDIDITLVGEDLNATDLLKIENEIDDLMLPYKVDLSLFSHIDNESLRRHILDVGKDL